jgi:hypothetical protein
MAHHHHAAIQHFQCSQASRFTRHSAAKHIVVEEPAFASLHLGRQTQTHAHRSHFAFVVARKIYIIASPIRRDHVAKYATRRLKTA